MLGHIAFSENAFSAVGGLFFGSSTQSFDFTKTTVGA